MTGWKAIQHIEWGATQRQMERGVILEFGHRKPCGPPSTVGVNKASREGFYRLVNTLCLAVHLWVIRRIDTQADASQLEKQLLEPTVEDPIVV